MTTTTTVTAKKNKITTTRACLEVVSWVRIARILREVQLLHLSQRNPIIIIAADVWIQLKHYAWQPSRIFIDNEVVWVMDENLVHERRSQKNVKLIKGVIGADFLVEVNAKQNSIPGCEEILCDQIFLFHYRPFCRKSQNNILDNLPLPESILSYAVFYW